MTYTTQKQVRAAFWQAHPRLLERAVELGIQKKRQNAQCATVHCAFLDYVDALQRAGEISESLAQRVTL